jgi:hypothetical protein
MASRGAARPGSDSTGWGRSVGRPRATARSVRGASRQAHGVVSISCGCLAVVADRVKLLCMKVRAWPGPDSGLDTPLVSSRTSLVFHALTTAYLLVNLLISSAIIACSNNSVIGTRDANHVERRVGADGRVPHAEPGKSLCGSLASGRPIREGRNKREGLLCAAPLSRGWRARRERRAARTHSRLCAKPKRATSGALGSRQRHRSLCAAQCAPHRQAGLVLCGTSASS